jgi:hypothetical protein
MSGSFMELDNSAGHCPGIEYRVGHLASSVAAGTHVVAGYSYDLGKAPAGGHCNLRGLSPLGQQAIGLLMDKHMMIDVDHMSSRSFYDTWRIAHSQKYPLLSGHSGMLDMQLSLAESKRLTSDDGNGWSDEGAEIVKHESLKSADQIAKIHDDGGMIAPILIPAAAKKFAGGAVDNDCPGSSKSWAQDYLYALSRTGARGLAIGTDSNGGTAYPAPRFGNEACTGVSHPDGAILGFSGARVTPAQLAARQTRRVKYRSAIGDCGGDRFERTREGHIRQGICTALSGRVDVSSDGKIWDSCQREIPCTTGDCTLANDTCKGMSWASCDNQDRGKPFAWIETYPAGEQRKGACLARRATACPTTGDASTIAICNAVKRFMPEFETDARGLERSTIGSRTFDINTDGMAHYGMLPDFLEDLKIVGVTERELDPLMHSAEDFIEMWEKIEGTRARGAWD